MNYNQLSKKQYEPVIETAEYAEEVIDEPVVEVAEDTTAVGTVTAKLLNVRADADSNSEVLGIIKKDAEVMIDLEESTDEFYSVCTESGLYGFCMKEFIDLKD